MIGYVNVVVHFVKRKYSGFIIVYFMANQEERKAII